MISLVGRTVLFDDDRGGFVDISSLIESCFEIVRVNACIQD